MSAHRIAAALALALLLGAAPALAQQAASQPAAASPEVQAPVPEVGPGRGGVGAGQVPATTEPGQPTGRATVPPPAAASAAPTRPLPAPPALGARRPDAAELELQAALRGERIAGRVSIPDSRAANLVQPAGRAWREFHNTTLAWVGGVAIPGMLVVLAAFFGLKGRIPIPGGTSGRSLTRFTLLERANHWMVASCFIVLGLSGLNLTFGRHLLLPLVGPDAFAALSAWGKLAHNYLAFPFTLGIVVMLLLWARDNIPERRDIDWLRLGGGLLGRGHPLAGRFNAGQKGVFWLTVLGGGLVAASGYLLIFPFSVTDIAGMQLAHMVHGGLAVLMVAAMLAHIYIGSIGMEGAIDAMSSGQVDYNWAKEHHGLWVEEEQARARAAVLPQGVASGARAAGAD